MKALNVILIGGAIFFGGRYILSLSRTGKKAVVQVGASVKGVSLEGVEVVLKYNIKNPTRSSIEMAAPLITLSHNGKVLASSSMALVDIPEAVQSNGRIKILPFKETGNITTSIRIPYLSLIGAGASLITMLKNRLNAGEDEQVEAVKFEIATTSRVYTKVGSYPYDDKTTVSV